MVKSNIVVTLTDPNALDEETCNIRSTDTSDRIIIEALATSKMAIMTSELKEALGIVEKFVSERKSSGQVAVVSSIINQDGSEINQDASMFNNIQRG